MTDRCEPPPELRGVDGWHWVQLSRSEEPTIARWKASCAWWNASGLGTVSAESAGNFGYIYIAPVATPAEVDAIRAERDTLKPRLLAEVNLASEERRRHEIEALYGPLLDADKAELATLRARVAELEGALAEIAAIDPIGINMVTGRLGWGEPPRAALIARAALSPATEG